MSEQGGELFSKVFNDRGVFLASAKAEKWCALNGLSVGTPCGNYPRAIRFGSWHIAKWKNLLPAQIDLLDGRMTGHMRSGPVTVELEISTARALGLVE